MHEQRTGFRFKDYLDSPNGREEFAQYMFDYHKSESTLDPRFTDEENLELYRLQYDRGKILRQHKYEQISDLELDTQIDALNDKVTAMLETSHQRQHMET